MKTLIVCAIYIISSTAAQLPSYIQPCSRSLPTEQLTHCVTEQARSIHAEFSKGIPEFGLQALDPLALDDTTAKSGTFFIKSKNLILTGLKDMDIREVRFNLDQNTGQMKLFGNMTFRGNYEMNGNILLIPLKGDGKITVKAINTDILIEYKIRKVRDSSGVEHLETYDLKQAQTFGRVVFHMTNLFDGIALSDTIHKVLNDNWQELMKEVGPPYTKAVANKVHEVIGKLYKNVPFDELFSP